MGLNAIIAKGVAIADRQTKSLQSRVTVAPWVSQDVTGTPTYGSPVTLRAIVEDREEQRRTPAGTLVTTRARLLFLKPIAPNGASGRVEPVDPRDVVTLQNGYSGPVLYVGGAPLNPADGYGYTTEVWLG